MTDDAPFEQDPPVEWDLLYPFVGPHANDPAYSRGWEMGRTAVELAMNNALGYSRLSVTIFKDNVDQFELVAMHAGWAIDGYGPEHPDHVDVDLSRIPPDFGAT